MVTIMSSLNKPTTKRYIGVGSTVMPAAEKNNNEREIVELNPMSCQWPKNDNNEIGKENQAFIQPFVMQY
jgi:hypothetical protein